MGCQTEIASAIVKGGGDYLLAVKGNQPTLHNAVHAALVESTKTPLSEETLSIEQEHGRIDGHEYHVLPAGVLAEQYPEWKALKSIGVAIFYRIESMKKFSMEYRYYISSAELRPELQPKPAVSQACGRAAICGHEQTISGKDTGCWVG